jgi:peroxiredoxin
VTPHFSSLSAPVRLLAAILLSFASLTAQAGSPLFQNLGSDVFESVDTHGGQGKWLVVMIWASDCEICKAEVGDYQRFHERHRHNAANVVGLTLDGSAGKQDALDFVNQHHLTFNNLIGEPEAVMSYFQILTGSPWIGTPSFLVFGLDGELMAKQVGALSPDVIEQFIVDNTSTPKL